MNPDSTASHSFNLRLALGLVGVLIAALTAGLNDRVTDLALADIRAAIGFDYDQASWITSDYQAAEVAAMMIAPWFAVTFSLRGFALAVAAGFAVTGILQPFASTPVMFFGLRILQGIFGGALPPLLMTVALRFLPPGIKLYGLAGYTLTATFGPNISPSLAALWTDSVGWQFVFWQGVPPTFVACLLMFWGLPQDPLRLERFRQIDLVGMLTGCGGIALMVLTLSQGERQDWLNSPLIMTMLLCSIILLILFLINEWYHPLPLFKLQLLARRNLTHGLLALAAILLVTLSGSTLPYAYFSQVEGFRTVQFAPLALTIGLPQLLFAPLTAALLNRRWIDSRWILCGGAALLCFSCLAGMQITTDWSRQNFWTIQLLQALGQPMLILPVLMSATSVVLPHEGPYASAMFNTVRGLVSVAAGSLIGNLLIHREKFHSHTLIDRSGNQPWLITADSSVSTGALKPLLPDASASSSDNLIQFATLIKHQALILSISDMYFTIAVFSLLLVPFTAWLPKRVYPPQTLIQPGTAATR